MQHITYNDTMLTTEAFRRKINQLTKAIDGLAERLTETEKVAKLVCKCRQTPSHYHKHGGKLPLAIRTMFNEIPICTGRTICEVQIEIGAIAEVESTPEQITEHITNMTRKGELAWRAGRFYRTPKMLTASGCRRIKGEDELQEIRVGK